MGTSRTEPGLTAATDPALTLRDQGGRIRACPGCGGLMVACQSNACQATNPSGQTYNRPFVRFCRRCGEPVDQTSLWDQVGRDGWDLVPRSIEPPELVADLSKYVEPTASRFLIATAMIRGMLAVHHAGQYLALLKADPIGNREPFPWMREDDPFPAYPDGSPPPPHTPVLLPGERYVMFSCSQGVLVLDLWSCHHLSAKANAPRYRLLRLKDRSLVVPPIPLGEQRIGLMTRGRTAELDYRWSVWDRSSLETEDANLSASLETEGAVAMGIKGRNCRCEVIDNRVITFSTVREHWVWSRDDADKSDLSTLKKTWPKRSTNPGDSIVQDDQDEFQTAFTQANQAFLVQQLVTGKQLRGVERFAWFHCVRRDGSSAIEAIERYEIEFDTLSAQSPQSINLPSGAKPIGVAPDQNDMQQMYFRVGTEIWFQNDGPTASLYKTGLPQTIVSHHLIGPLILSVGQKDQGARYLQLDSLRYPRAQANVPIENKLHSDPLLWYRWLFTVELDGDDRLVVRRRVVNFVAPESRK